MTGKIYLILLLSVMDCIMMSAQTHIQVRGQKSVKSYPVEEVENIRFDSSESEAEMIIKYYNNNNEYVYKSDEFRSVTFGHYVPEIHINTDDQNIYDVQDKENYLPATFKMKSNGYPGAVDIDNLKLNVRGRGNSSLTFDKKPYRLKFDKKQLLHSDLKEAKNYVLIANYIDNSIMRTTAAFTIARLLEMPYTNHIIPVDVFFNDRYAGAYILTEKVGFNSGHMDDIDEMEGILFELDLYFDEPYRFLSECYHLPMMIKDPDIDDLKKVGSIEDTKTFLNSWKKDWNKVERVLSQKDSGNIWEYIDLPSLVDFLIVNNLTNNGEISLPKSNFIYKSKIGPSEKYHFGPVWDFDYSFTFYDGGEGFGTFDHNIFDDDRRNSLGSRFYRTLIQTPGFEKAYNERWEYFVTELYPQLCEYLDNYAYIIEESAIKNFELWPPRFGYNVTYDNELNDFRNGYKVLREFLDKRIDYLNKAPNHGFFKNGD